MKETYKFVPINLEGGFYDSILVDGGRQVKKYSNISKENLLSILNPQQKKDFANGKLIFKLDRQTLTMASAYIFG